MDTTKLGDKLEGEGSLAKAIRGAAYNVAIRQSVDVDDVHQDIVLAILEKFAVEPEFLEQTDSYIVYWGVWKAQENLRAMRTRTERDKPLDPVHFAGSSNPYEEIVAGLADDPWDEVNANLDLPSPDMAAWTQEVVAGLDPQNREICKSHMAGKRARQIGPEVGIHWQTVYSRMRGEIRHEFLRAGYPG